MAKCVVDPCNAVTCIHNKNRQCMLPKVTINKSGGCEQFDEGSGPTIEPPKDKWPPEDRTPMWQEQLKPQQTPYPKREKLEPKRRKLE